MIVLKPGEEIPSETDESRPSSGNSRSGSANRVQRDIPTIKRKSKEEIIDIPVNGYKEEVSVKQNETLKAPLELTAQFLKAIMGKDYKLAQLLCVEILKIEPSNSIVQDFQDVLAQKLNQENMASEDEEVTSESEDSDFDECTENEESSSEEDSDSEEEDEVEESNEEESDTELSVEDIKNLNLFMGGMSIVRK